jgi:hypothetical protein
MNLNEATQLYEQYEIDKGIKQLPVVKPPGMCCEDDCDGKMIPADHFPYCDTCGIMDTDHPLVTSREANEPWIPKRVLYKRRQYCLEKLKLVVGIKNSRSSKYHEMVKQLKEQDFDTLQELRQLMKELGYHKMYKFIYSAYFDVKGTHLISFSTQEIHFLAQQFVELEWKFKQSEDHKRKNFMCYNSTLYYLMKKNKLTGYKHLLLPYNHKHINQLLKSIDSA